MKTEKMTKVAIGNRMDMIDDIFNKMRQGGQGWFVHSPTAVKLGKEYEELQKALEKFYVIVDAGRVIG